MDGLQPPPQLDPGHAAELDVEHEASRIVYRPGIKKCFRRNETLGGKPRAANSRSMASACLLVVNDRNHLR